MFDDLEIPIWWQGLDVAFGGEFSGPHHVNAQHSHLWVLDLGVLYHLLPLLVCRVGQLVEGDLAVGVRVIELLDQLRKVTRGVLALPDLNVTLLGEVNRGGRRCTAFGCCATTATTTRRGDEQGTK